MRFTWVKLAKPSIDTHEWRPYEGLWERYSAKAARLAYTNDGFFSLACDPFARNCTWAAPFTNDLNIDTLARDHLDAEVYLQTLKDKGEKFGIVLLDPPFSDRMAKDRYGTGNLYASDSGKMTRIQKLAGDLVIPEGFIIKAGYNTSRPHPCFELVEIRLVCMGPIQADVIFSVWEKRQHTMEDW